MRPTESFQVPLEVAETYEATFVPAIFAEWATRALDAGGVGPGTRLLDVACGTGIVARLAAERVGPTGTVAGLDPNPAMISVAREAASAAPSIAWHEAPAEAMPLPDESVDVVLCGQGLQFFSDREAGLREMRRVLVPGGRMLANMPGPIPAPLAALAEALAGTVGPEAAHFVEGIFSLHDETLLRSLATGAGFDQTEVRSERMTLRLPPPADFLWQYVHSTPLAATLVALDDEGREALERDFSERCRDLLEGDALRLDVRMTTLSARAGG
jgi:ubiquinone/menaquinone biosynthesis C-methylase UbiE